MKKKILVIVGNYEVPSSVAINLKPFLKNLDTNKYEIDIVTNGAVNSKKKDGHLNIYITENKLEKFYQKNFKSSLGTFLFKLIRKTITLLIFKFGNYFFLETRYVGWSQRKTIKLCKKLNNQNNYDYLLSVSLPFKSNRIAYSLAKQTKIKWYMFSFDPFACNEAENSTKIKKSISKKLELKYFASCNKLLLTPELISFYKNSRYTEYLNKMVEIPYATLDFADKKSKPFDFLQKKYVCLYSGRLYLDVRNPDVMIKTFEKISILDLFIITDYKEAVFDNQVNSINNIHKLPMGDYEYGQSAVDSANILINIGNNVPYQVPGKIFELMSTGKPIIHFSKGSDDESIKYLLRYPLCLIVYEKEINEETIIKIEEFCKNNSNKKLTKEEINENLREYNSERAKNKFSYLFE